MIIGLPIILCFCEQKTSRRVFDVFEYKAQLLQVQIV